MPPCHDPTKGSVWNAGHTPTMLVAVILALGERILYIGDAPSEKMSICMAEGATSERILQTSIGFAKLVSRIFGGRRDDRPPGCSLRCPLRQTHSAADNCGGAGSISRNRVKRRRLLDPRFHVSRASD